MFSKVALFVAASLAVFVAATPVPTDGGSCNTGSIQCCNSWQDSKSEAGATLLSVFGLAAQGVTGQVGAQCSPVSAIGLGGGASCHQAPMCCSNNNYNGLIVVGCTPINVGL